AEPERGFHFFPFSFAASWIAMLSFVSRNSTLTLSTDLSKLADELKLASPNYFLMFRRCWNAYARQFKRRSESGAVLRPTCFRRRNTRLPDRKATKNGS